MSELVHQNRTVEARAVTDRNRGRLLAAGSVAGALLASSCCVVPLLLVALGISGAWIGNLTALAPYKWYFLSVSTLLLATAFWHVYFKPEKACPEDTVCTRPASGWITKTVLWITISLVLLSATVNLWAPLFY